MNKTVKTLLAAACIFGALLSAGITAFLNVKSERNRNFFGEWLAPISINVEIGARYAPYLSVFSESAVQHRYDLSPTTAESSAKIETIVLHAELKTSAFQRKIYLMTPAARADETLAAIDSISVFIGNRLRYFSSPDIRNFERTEKDGNVLFYIPNLYYTKSLVVKNWANYYGDFNIALLLFCYYLLNPFRFFISYLFLAGLVLLYRRQLGELYRRCSQNPRIVEVVLLLLIIVFGFVLRFNGYTRHSGWTDEIYSAVRSGNPTLPFMAVFSDPGNPPFYNILLRFVFILFGWSEETGTMLSVVLGTLAIPALYFFVRQSAGRKTALTAALFLALSGYAVGYSHEMRGYILKMALAPLSGLLLFRFIKKPMLGNLLLYILPSICIVNTHYYGVLFIFANFLFYCLYGIFTGSFKWEKTLLFLAGNVVIALSLLPVFLYQINRGYYFTRGEEHGIQIQHIAVMLVIVFFAVMAFIYRKRLAPDKMFFAAQKNLFLYALWTPPAIFTLAFLVSIKRPILSWSYPLPISYPFLLIVIAMLIAVSLRSAKFKSIFVLLVWMMCAALYQGKANIPGGGREEYREARAYIAADAAAHPEQRSVMLDNAPQNARYYGFPELPAYSPDTPADVVYVFNDIFIMHVDDMYRSMSEAGLDDGDMLKIWPNGEVPVFKKYLVRRE